jgi:Sec-independent protein translocase protein TatA
LVSDEVYDEVVFDGDFVRSLGSGARELKKAASEEDENQAGEAKKVEARELRGEKTKPTPQEDARLGE